MPSPRHLSTKLKRLAATLTIILMLAAGVGAYLLSPKTAEAQWYDGGWPARKRLQINRSQTSGTHTDMPILISITDVDVKNNAQADGDDILFTKADGRTRLDHEIESYTSSSGTLVAWVRIPTVSAHDATDIYMYYGNPGVNSQANPSGIWAGSYRGVYDLDEGSGTTAIDKTAFANSLTLSTSTWLSAAKIVGGWNGTGNAWLSRTDDDDFDFAAANSFTISAWVKSDFAANAGATQWVVNKSLSGGTQQAGYAIYFNTSGQVCFGIDDDTTWSPDDQACSGTDYYDGNWHYIAAVKTGTTSIVMYVDGVAAATDSSISATGTLANTRDFIIGDRQASDASDEFGGDIDDFRITATNRSAEWLLTEFNNQNSPSTFITLSATEERLSTVLNWKFDEGFGDTVYDSTDSRINGTLGASSAAPTRRTADLCLFEGCVSFDGTDDLISKTYSASTDTGLDPGTDAFAVSMWFRHGNSISQNETLISRYNNGGYDLYMNTSGQICFRVAQNGTALASGDSICSANSFNNNQWYFVKAVRDPDSSNKQVVYVSSSIEGALTSLTNTGSISGSSPTIYIGIASDGSSNPWNGFIDDVKVYRESNDLGKMRADTASNNYQEGASAVFGAPDVGETLSNGLVAYWRLEETAEGSCTGGALDACDSSSAGNHGEWEGSVSNDDGKFGQSVLFDAGGESITVADSTSLDLTNRMTMSMWVNSADADTGVLVGKGRDAYQLEITDGLDLVMYFNNSALLTGTMPSGWNHIVVTYDSVNAILYVNGELIQSVAVAQGITTNNTALTIGDSFLGRLDDVRLYNRPFSEYEIRFFYDWGPEPITHFKMEESDGVTLNNSGRDTTDATLTCTGGGCTNPTWLPGKYGGGISFSHSNGSYAVLNSTGMTINPLDPFTVSLWVYPEEIVSGETENLMCDDSGTLFCLRLLGTSDSAAKVDVCVDGSLCGSNPDTGSSVVTERKWSHIVVTYNGGTDTYIVYVDGIDRSADNTSSTVSDMSGQQLYIGMVDPDGTPDGCNCRIDDIKLYDYARTQKQVISDLNNNHPAIGGPVGAPVAYWNFDEGSGSTVYSNGNCVTVCNATISNFSDPPTSSSGRTPEGRYDKALRFDGSNDYVSIGNDFQLRIPSQITLSAWVKPENTNRTIVSKWDTSSGRSYRLHINSSSQVEFSLSSNGSNESTVTSSATLLTDGTTWYHVVATYDGTNMKLFINGDSDNTLARTGTIYEGSENVQIGAAFTSGTRSSYFDGIIDEVRIYNYALNDTETGQEYFKGGTALIGTLSTASDGVTPDDSGDRSYCVPGDTATCRAPKVWLKLDEKSGGTFNDSSGFSNTASMQSGSDYSWVRGKNNWAVRINENDAQYFHINDESPFDFTTGGFTLQGWFNITSFQGGSNSDFFFKDSVYGLERNGSNNSLKLTTTGLTDNSLESTYTITDSEWHHIAAVWNGTTKYIYIDGQVNVSESATGTLSTSSGRVEIGDDTNTGSAFQDFTSDDIMVYDYGRTARQINWDMTRGAPYAWWKFDECNSTTANDAGRGSSNATITIGSSGNYTAIGTCDSGTASQAWQAGTDGKFNSAMAYDGTDDYTDAGDLSFTESASQLSWSFWLKPTSLSTSNVYLAKANNNATQRSYAITAGSSDSSTIVVAIPTSTTDVNTYATTPASTVSSGDWIHITAVFDGTQSGNSNRLKVYRNGKELSLTFTGTIPATTQATTSNFRVAAYANGGSYFNGLVDDVRLYNYPLTALQIQSLFIGGGAAVFGPTTGLP